MVHRVEIGNEEVDVIDAKMHGDAELNRQCNLSQGLGRLLRNDSSEQRVYGGEVFLGEPYLS